MQQILLFSLLGLGSGALIAGIALGVVLTYRGSGIINLATGGMAMLAGYAFWALRVHLLHWPAAPALIVSLLIVMAVGAATELVAFRPLRTAAPLAKLVSSLGVLLVLQASMLLAFGTTQQPEPTVLPQNTVKVFSAVIPVDRFILTGIVIVLAAALAALYRFTRFGLATRAASENEVVAMLGGLSPNRLSIVNTLLASLIAGGVGILAASITQLDTSTLPLQIVPALAAALLARFTSFGLACAAGIGLGILESLIEYVTSQSWFPQSGGVALPGVQELIVFVLIVLFMYLRGSRLPTRGELVERRLPDAPRPQRLAVTAPALAAVCAIALVVLPFDFREALVNSMIGALIALSLIVITGFVGQISVLQLTLAGVSGFTISHLAVNAGIGFPLAPLLGAGAALVLGLITAASALRVRGVSLAVVTLAAVVAITNFGFTNTTWGGGQTGSPVPEPRLLGLDLGPRAAFRGLDGNLPSPIFGWLVLAVTVALCVLVGLLRRGTLGQRMLAVRSNERAAAAAAIDPRAVKLIAFGISALIAGLAGALYAYNFGSVSADRFDPFTALSLIAFAYAGGITLISGALFAGLISTQALFPYALDKWFGINGNWFLLFGGAILIITLIQNPEGVAGAFYKRTHKREPVRAPDLGSIGLAPFDVPPDDLAAGAVRRGGDAESAVAAGVAPGVHAGRRAGTPGATGPTDAAKRPQYTPVLAVRNLSVAFGGVHALEQVDLEVREGELVGLIGPNGAGKTTLIDAVTGFVPFTGRVELDGQDISSLSAHQRARRGLARTWQNTDLFDDLEVGENVAVAAAGPLRAPAREGDGAGSVDPGQVLALVDLGWAADAMPDQLSEGARKLVGVARALAGHPRLLCLDEPAAGLDARESEELGRALRELADRGQSTLLIDHDMGLVLSICDRVVVLEFGRVIADGPPDVVRQDERVIAAYLGGGAELVASEAESSTGGNHESP
ncbi:MAG: ATP-binding cassette domain-containing protein [Solirubrobacterales bacterium]|nr:ATP-binding cassette domain-containing protein [Solirubrobacterales bacterium]MBV9941193.1 ATP-binding cassette domain-containing protein [Solirubrobacterales bacterium]